MCDKVFVTKPHVNPRFVIQINFLSNISMTFKGVFKKKFFIRECFREKISIDELIKCKKTAFGIESNNDVDQPIFILKVKDLKISTLKEDIFIEEGLIETDQKISKQ